MNTPKVSYSARGEGRYKAGNFVYSVDGRCVLVTKNTSQGLFVNVALYQYQTVEAAEDAAYRMAFKQANA
jgi:hypothetical protein